MRDYSMIDTNEFENWFNGIFSSWHTNTGPIYRDTLRGCREELYKEFMRLKSGGESRLTFLPHEEFIKEREDERLRASLAKKEKKVGVSGVSGKDGRSRRKGKGKT